MFLKLLCCFLLPRKVISYYQVISVFIEQMINLALLNYLKAFLQNNHVVVMDRRPWQGEMDKTVYNIIELFTRTLVEVALGMVDLSLNPQVVAGSTERAVRRFNMLIYCHSHCKVHCFHSHQYVGPPWDMTIQTTLICIYMCKCRR